MYICTKQILTPVLGLDTYWGQGGLELWDCHQVDRGIKRDRDLGTKQNWDINFNNQQNVTLYKRKYCQAQPNFNSNFS